VADKLVEWFCFMLTLINLPDLKQTYPPLNLSTALLKLTKFKNDSTVLTFSTTHFRKVSVSCPALKRRRQQPGRIAVVSGHRESASCA
jgi:hypothetical protein